MKQALRFTFIAALSTLSLSAQMKDNQSKDLRCSDHHSGRRGSFCEVREMTAPSAGRLNVDAGTNGGVSLKGWSRSDTLVRFEVQAQGATDAEAQSVAAQVHVSVNAGKVMVNGPGASGDVNWSVSFEIFVPHRTDLELTALNGGIHISDVNGDIQFKTTNGGIHLSRLAGRVRGSTTNGGIHADFTGNRWDGSEFDVQTVNGGVHLNVPQEFSARLESSTVSGRVHADLAGIKTDRETRQIASVVGAGGPLVRAVTTNGGVHIGHE
jgi:DUF4097 and DUF4098 domain-containing protein YvlB